MKKSKAFLLFLHLTAWGLLFVLQVISLGKPHQPPPGNHFGPPPPNISMIISSNLAAFFLFYINYLFLFPRLFKKQKYVTYIVLLIVATIATYIAQDILRAIILFPTEQNFHPGFRLHFGPVMIMFFLIAALSTGIGVANEWIKSNQRLKEIEAEKLNTELIGLKSQINPHFLFNSLNTIYALTLVESSNATAAVIQLSNMMRYVMEDAQEDHVPIEKEIEHLQNYIAFQELRANDNLHINFIISNDATHSIHIAPLILISFIENAFKYGISAQEFSEIKIQLSVSNTDLHFTISNKIFPNLSTLEREKGIGLSNTKRRLELMYPNKHELIIENKTQTFFVDLKIDLT